MSIRFANSEDFMQIQSLWKISFPEDPAFNDWFFKNIYRDENTLVHVVGNQVCAMLQMYPYYLTMDEFALPVQYIYGVCTHPDFRKQGLMAQLLHFAWEIGKENGQSASVLIPQENWLFDIYGKFGYRCGFFLEKIDLDVARKPWEDCLIVEAAEEDIDQMSSIYKQQTSAQPGVMLRSRDDWTKQMRLYRAMGGHVYCLKRNESCYAYGFVSFSDEILTIQEGFGLSREALLTLAEQAAKKENKQDVMILTSYHHQGNRIPFGCIKFFDDQYQGDFSGYMNLMFN